MKKKHLLFIALVLCGISMKAQIYPGVMYSLDFTYDACPHNQQIWSYAGYTMYDVQMVKDANGYINSLQTSTPPPFDASADKFRSTGSRVGNLYTATSSEQLSGETVYTNFVKETWQGDGIRDTSFVEQDSSAGVWENSIKRVLYYAGSICDSTKDFSWQTNAWVQTKKMTITYAAGKKDKFSTYNWNASTSSWTYQGYSQYYYTTKLDSIFCTAVDQGTGIESFIQKYYFTNNASGETTSLTSYDWNATNLAWVQAITITFVTSAGISEIENKNLKIYPNPANSTLYFDGISEDANISIFDMSGKMVIDQQTSNKQFDISNLISGSYTIRISDKNGIATKKFIKQ